MVIPTPWSVQGRSREGGVEKGCGQPQPCTGKGVVKKGAVNLSPVQGRVGLKRVRSVQSHSSQGVGCGQPQPSASHRRGVVKRVCGQQYKAKSISKGVSSC